MHDLIAFERRDVEGTRVCVEGTRRCVEVTGRCVEGTRVCVIANYKVGNNNDCLLKAARLRDLKEPS